MNPSANYSTSGQARNPVAAQVDNSLRFRLSDLASRLELESSRGMAIAENLNPQPRPADIAVGQAPQPSGIWDSITRIENALRVIEHSHEEALKSLG